MEKYLLIGIIHKKLISTTYKIILCFPIYRRLYLQSRCNQFGTGYKLQKNDGNEVPELLNYND